MGWLFLALVGVVVWLSGYHFLVLVFYDLCAVVAYCF